MGLEGGCREGTCLFLHKHVHVYSHTSLDTHTAPLRSLHFTHSHSKLIHTHTCAVFTHLMPVLRLVSGRRPGGNHAQVFPFESSLSTDSLHVYNRHVQTVGLMRGDICQHTVNLSLVMHHLSICPKTKKWEEKGHGGFSTGGV